MRKVNFNTLDNLTVPPALIEKALMIPDTPAPKRIIPLRRFVTAASVVLVFALSISLLFFIRNKSAIPVAPAPASAPTEKATENGALSIPPTEAETEFGTQKLSSPTEPATQTATDHIGRITVVPATSPTQGSTVTPTLSPDLPTQHSSEKPTQVPTQKPAVKPTEPQKPTLAPATEQPTAQPTVPTSPEAQLPTVPDDDATEEPHAGSPGAPGNAAISSSVSSHLLTGSGRVYCVLYDRAEKRVDSEPIVSPKHEAIPRISYGYAYFYYIPPAEWNLAAGMYEMEVYNEDGICIDRRIISFNNE